MIMKKNTNKLDKGITSASRVVRGQFSLHWFFGLCGVKSLPCKIQRLNMWVQNRRASVRGNASTKVDEREKRLTTMTWKLNWDFKRDSRPRLVVLFTLRSTVIGAWNHGALRGNFLRFSGGHFYFLFLFLYRWGEPERHFMSECIFV